MDGRAFEGELPLNPSVPNVAPTAGHAVRMSRRRWPAYAGWAAAAAACVFLWLKIAWEEPSSGEEPSIGVLTQAVNPQWHEARDELASGAQLTAGTFRASRGFFQIELRSGVSVAAEAPLDLELVGGMKIICREGALRIRVPERARGFKVVTMDRIVVDYGTEFGVSVRSGHAAVEVFEGEVGVGKIHGEIEKMVRTGDHVGWRHGGSLVNRPEGGAFPEFPHPGAPGPGGQPQAGALARPTMPPPRISIQRMDAARAPRVTHAAYALTHVGGGTV